MEKLLKLLSTLIPLLSCYPRWAQIFFTFLLIQTLVAVAIFVLYYGSASKLVEARKEPSFNITKPTNGEFITAPKVVIQGRGANPSQHNSMSVRTLHVDSGTENIQTGRLVVESDGTWAFEYCTFEQLGLHEIIIDAVFGGKRFSARQSVNFVGWNESGFFNLAIHITKHYRSRFEFSIIGPPDGHFLVNRLYLLYVNEFEWKRRPPEIEAWLFKIFYRIHLSRQFAEYDLLPLTTDDLAHGFEYEGSESDHFAVLLYGTKVSIVRICAEVYDVKHSRSFLLQSEDLQIVAGSNMIPLWDRPLTVGQKKLADEMSPAAYKMITALDYEDFIPKFDTRLLEKAREELASLNEQLSSGSLKEHVSDVIALIDKTVENRGQTKTGQP